MLKLFLLMGILSLTICGVTTSDSKKTPPESRRASTMSLYNRGSEGDATWWAVYRNDEPKLPVENFDSTYYRSCTLGVWVFYTEENYFGKGSARAIDYYSCSSTQMPEGNFPFKSLRVVGIPENFNATMMTFYHGVDYEGVKFEFEVDEPRMEGFEFKSFLLMGPSEVTLFSGFEFSGDSLCIRAQEFNRVVTYIYNIDTQLPLPSDQIKSIKFGCHSKNIHKFAL